MARNQSHRHARQVLWSLLRHSPYAKPIRNLSPQLNADWTEFDGNFKRGGAAESATSFVLAAAGRHLCILALNRVNVVAVTTIQYLSGMSV